MTYPKISIVTPSFNQGKYLDETMRLVLDQNYPNLEYIVVDGGSTDDSVDVIKRHENRLAWWVSEKDHGQTDALNKGVARCTGDIFGYINSDDLLLPGSLERVARTWMDDSPTWIVGWSKYMEIGGGDWPYTVRPVHRRIDWFLHNPIPQQSSFWATKYFKEIGNFREDMHYCFDYEYWMRLRFVAEARPAIVRKCLGAFRLHEESKTVSVWDKFLPEFTQIRKEYRKYLTARDVRQWRRELRVESAVSARDRMWQALNKNDVKGARKEAKRAVHDQPLSFESWKAFYFALRGHA